MYEEALGNPPTHCDHKPPKVATIRAGGGVRVQCLTCGTVGPERESPGEAFVALLKTPYRANRSDINSTCVATDRRMKGPRGAFVSRVEAVLRPLL
jgi:hypothetical protein